MYIVGWPKHASKRVSLYTLYFFWQTYKMYSKFEKYYSLLLTIVIYIYLELNILN